MTGRPNWFIAWPVLDITMDPSLDALTWSPSLRRLVPSDLHVTLSFLGKVDEAHARAAFDRVRALSGLELPHRVPLVGARFLGHEGSALTLLVGDEASPLADLMTRGEAAASSVLERPASERPPLPHLTIARTTRGTTDADRGEALATLGVALAARPPVRLDAPALYTWSPDRGAGGSTEFVIAAR